MSDGPATLLVEIGCEEIPARMIRRAAADLGAALAERLRREGFGGGEPRAWGGSRRLSVRIEGVAARQPDRDEQVLGPPERAAFREGQPTRAAQGFAAKHGVAVADLQVLETERGRYAGLRRHVTGRPLGAALAATFPVDVAAMSFPKTMRWAEGRARWVRPVHWVLALHGERPLDLELFGIRSAPRSRGHRFLGGGGEVAVPRPDAYEAALAAARVVVDPAERRRRVRQALDVAARELGGSPVPDAALLEEVADLVEWPGVVGGRFDPCYLELPREILVTTLRHHQKCFSVVAEDGGLLASFLAVANTDRDPAGHIRRGNEWVVGGRLEDARFFWREDRSRPLTERSGRLAGIVFHGSRTYRDKASEMERLAGELAAAVGLDDEAAGACRLAAKLAKNDLVTGTVGEFPELQGRVGGLLLREEGRPEAVHRAVYEHYQPQGPDDPAPASATGAVVAAADKLESIATLVAAGERPTGSRDPFALRRASSGLFRIAVERQWPLSLAAMARLASAGAEPVAELPEFLRERWVNFLRDRGAAPNEIRAVLSEGGDPAAADALALHDVVARLEAIGGVRQRADFAQLVELTKRVDNILTRNAETFAAAAGGVDESAPWEDPAPAAARLWQRTGEAEAELRELESAGRYGDVVDRLAGFVGPVERFFTDVLVVDPDDPQAMARRGARLARLRSVLTRCYDIRELAGQAEGSD